MTYPYTRQEQSTPINGIGHCIDVLDPTIARALQGSPRGLRVDDSNLNLALTSLSEIAVTERTSLIELNSSYGLSELRDDWTETDGATITSSATSEHQLSTGTTGTGRVVLDSIKTGRYIPGYPSEIGVGFRLDSGNVWETGHDFVWGGSDYTGDNQLVFGRDVNGMYVNRRNQGQDNKVYQANWNVDVLDGTGPSEYTLDETIGSIYRIEYTWYGYGEIRFGIIGHDYSGNQVFIPCHVFKEFTETSIARPNLKVHVAAENGGATTNNIGYVAGRQYSVVGKYIPKYRYVDDFRTATLGTTSIPLISFNRKTGFDDRAIGVEGIDFSIDNGPVLLEVFVKTSLVGSSPGVPDSYNDSEIAVQSDTAATDYSGGILIYRKMVNAGQGQSLTFDTADFDYDLQSGTNVTLTARALSGSPGITALFRLKEYW